MSDENEVQQPDSPAIPAPPEASPESSDPEQDARPPSILQGHLGTGPAQIWASAFLIVILGVIAYSNAFSIPFHIDEQRMLSEQPTPSGVLLSSEDVATPLVYPLTRLSLAVNWWFTPYSPVGFRALNLALHLAASVLVFLTAYRLLARSTERRPAAARMRIPAAMLAGMFFAVHPALTTPLHALGERAALLTGFAMILCVAAFLRLTDRNRPSSVVAMLMFLAYGAALAGGDYGYALPALLIGVDGLAHGAGGVRARSRLHLLVWGGLGLVLVARWVAVPDAFRLGLAGLYEQTDAFVRLLPAAATGRGLRMVYAAGDGGAVPVGIWALALLAGVVFTIRRKLAGFALLWTAAAFAPGILLAPACPLVTELQLYVPLLGAVLLLPWVFVTFLTQDKLMRIGGVAAAALVLAAGAGTYLRNGLWADEYVLWEDTAAKMPGHPEALLRLGSIGVAQAESTLGDLAAGTIDRDSAAAQALENQAIDAFETAENHLRQARRLLPDSVDLLYPLGVSLERQEKRDDAIEVLRRVLELDIAHQPATLTLAAAYHARAIDGGAHADLLAAIDYFQRAARLGPLAPPQQAAWGVALAMLGDLPAAEAVLRIAAQANPDGGGPYAGPLAQVESALARVRELEQQAQAVMGAQGAGSPTVALIRAQESIQLNQYLQAFYLLDRFLTAMPENRTAWTMMGVVKAAMGDREGFLEHWGDVIPTRAGAAEAWKQLAQSCAGRGMWEDAQFYLESPVASVAVQQPLIVLGDVAREFEMTPQAVAFYRESAQARPNDYAPWLSLFEIAIEAGDRTTARGYLLEAEERGAPEPELASRRDQLGEATQVQEEGPVTTIIR